MARAKGTRAGVFQGRLPRSVSIVVTFPGVCPSHCMGATERAPSSGSGGGGGGESRDLTRAWGTQADREGAASGGTTSLQE